MVLHDPALPIARVIPQDEDDLYQPALSLTLVPLVPANAEIQIKRPTLEGYPPTTSDPETYDLLVTSFDGCIMRWGSLASPISPDPDAGDTQPSGSMNEPMATTRESLKHELLSRVADFNAGKSSPSDFPEIAGLIEKLKALSPIPDPANHLSSVAGRWASLYASFGVGHSKGKSHQDDSTLSLQTFKAFPDIPIRVNDIVQEIGVVPNAYNNVIAFETVTRASRGMIIVHGTYECDAEDAKRFRVVFYGAEIRGLDSRNDSELRQSLGLPDDYALKRDFKPVKLYSDIVYLDDTTRINIGGMGGVYVLERCLEPAISL